MTAGTLYVVATPIGNLEDITLRALAVLRSVEVIACEDTRRTRILLDRHGIAGPKLVPFHKFNEKGASSALVDRLQRGEDVAIVSDGGTPAISDPGYRLVRDALDAAIQVTPIPGPSAFVAALSASGLPSDRVTFHGFLPHRSGERRKVIESIRDESATQVFYDSPRRVTGSLRDLAEILGERRVAVARELTKRFETWHRGTLSEVLERVSQGPAKGEFCLVVEGAPARAGRKATARTGGGENSAPTLFHQRSAAPKPPHGVGLTPSASGRGARARGGLARSETISGGQRDRATPASHGTSSPPPHRPDQVAVSPTELRRFYARALASGIERREALKRAAGAFGLPRKEAYRILKTRPGVP